MNNTKRFKIGLLVFMAMMTVSVFIAPHSAMAQGSGGGSGNSGSVGDGLSTLKNNNSGITNLGITGTGREGVVQLVAKIIDYALYLSGAIAVLFIIIGGYRYLTSAGNEEGAKKGRTTVVNALIGLVIIILAYVIVNVVVNFIST